MDEMFRPDSGPLPEEGGRGERFCLYQITPALDAVSNAAGSLRRRWTDIGLLLLGRGPG